MSSGSELLLHYVRERSAETFAPVVAAHIDLVFSAASRRLNGDPHAAAEVTQDVFLALARNAERLVRHPALNAWLHTATRNAALNHRRREERYERRKQHLIAMQETSPAPQVSESWQSAREFIDSALDGLSEVDRNAVVLRFFEGRSFSAIGEALGLQEEAARRRVERALEKLRVRLARHGVKSSAAALGAALSAHAIGGAPAGLASSIASATALTSAPSAVAGFFYFMSTTKIVVSAGALALVAAAGFTFGRLSSHDAAPEKKAVAPAPPIATARKAASRPASSPSVPPLSGVQPAKNEPDEKVAALKDMFARLPELSIPQLKLATVADWYVAVDGPLETEDDYRLALAKIRALTESRFAKLAHPALRAYLQTHDDKFPSDPMLLKPFVDERIDEAMLRHYRVAPATEVPNVRMSGDLIMTQQTLVDSDYDDRIVIGPGGWGSASGGGKDAAALDPMVEAFRAATGHDPIDIKELLPYAHTPEERAAVERVMRRSEAER